MNDQQNLQSTALKPKKAEIYRFFSIVFLLVSIAVGTVAFTTAYKSDTGYLDSSLQKTLLYSVIVAEIILAAVAAILNKTEGKISCRTGIDNLSALISTLVTACCGAMAVISIKSAKFLIGQNVITVLGTILLISAVASFFFNPAIWQRNKNRDAFLLISGYANIFLCISIIAILYFDVSVEMNNPQKLLIQFSSAAICLSTLSELKVFIRGKGIGLLIFTKLCSIALCPIAAISAFVSLSGNKHFSRFYFFAALLLLVCGTANAIKLFLSKVEEIPDNPQNDCNQSVKISDSEIPNEEIVQETPENTSAVEPSSVESADEKSDVKN